MSRNHLPSAAKNGALNIGTSILSAAGKSGAYFIGPALLSPKEFGVYAYLSWLAAVAAQVGAAGFMQSAQRFRCRFQERESFFSSLLLLPSVLLTLAVAGILLLLPKQFPTHGALLWLTVIAATATALASVQQALLQARHDFKQPLRAEAGAQVGKLGGLAALKVIGSVAPGALLAVDAVAATLKTFLLRWRGAAQRSSVDASIVTTRELLSYAGSMMLLAVMDVLIWQRGEMFFLGRYSGVAAAAHFAVAAQLSQLLVLAPTAALASLLPRLAEKSYAGSDQFNHSVNTLLTISAIAVIPLYALSILFAPAILHLWKPSYAAVGAIFPALMIGKIALIVSAPLSLALYASGRQKAMFPVVCTAGLVATFSDYISIRHFGLTGAAWACAFNQVFIGVCTFAAAQRYLKIKLHLSAAVVTVLAFLLLVLVALSFTQYRTLAAIGCPIVVLAALWREPFFAAHTRGIYRSMRLRSLVEENA